MRGVRILALSAVAAAWIGDPTAAFADGCLQRFSCQIYGECRLPCLDDLLGNRPAPAVDPTALDAQPTGSLSAKAEASNAVSQTPRSPVRLKLAHHKTNLDESAPSQAASLRVVAGREIASLTQLAGKPVSFGPPGDAAQAAGRKLFARLGIKVDETPLDLDNALDGLATGDIAAVLVSRPRDVAKAKAARDLHLLPAPEGVVARGD